MPILLNILNELDVQFPELDELKKAFADKSSKHSLIENNIRTDTKDYISNQEYLDDVRLAGINTFVPALKIVLDKTKDSHLKKNRDFIENELKNTDEELKRFYWECVVAGYIIGLLSSRHEHSPLYSADMSGIGHRSPHEMTVDVVEEIQDDIFKARIYNFITQEYLNILIKIPIYSDDVLSEYIPTLKPLVIKDAQGNRKHTLGSDCLILLTIGLGLSINDML